MYQIYIVLVVFPYLVIYLENKFLNLQWEFAYRKIIKKVLMDIYIQNSSLYKYKNNYDYFYYFEKWKIYDMMRHPLP